MEICCMSQGTQTGTLQQPRGVRKGGRREGGSRGKRHRYTYGYFMAMCGRNQTNTVKQLSLN